MLSVIPLRGNFAPVNNNTGGFQIQNTLFAEKKSYYSEDTANSGCNVRS